MTTLSSTPIGFEPGPDDRAMPADQPAADEIAHDSPEQEWCEDCAPEDEPFNEYDSPGMPREVIERSVETPSGWDEYLGPGPEYSVTHLTCGHTLSWLL